MKEHGVNKCPKITHAQRKQFWEGRNKSRREKAYTASKEGTACIPIAEVAVVVPEEYDAARIN